MPDTPPVRDQFPGEAAEKPATRISEAQRPRHRGRTGFRGRDFAVWRDLAIVGRYILTPDIFGLLTTTAPNHTGEIQLTDALRSLLPHRPVYAYEFKGIRHDTGNKLGFLRAVVYFALRHPELAEPFAQHLRSLDLHPASRSGRGKDHPLVHIQGSA